MAQSPSLHSSVDAELIGRALRKVMNREDLTKAERAALKRHEKEKEERLRWQYYACIPQKHWRQTGSVVKHIGEGFHINWLPAEELHLVKIDADHWKTWVHQRLTTPFGNPGAMSLFRAEPQEHLALAKHLTAEQKVEEFIAGRGVVVKWERLRRQNHWFDALYNACAAGHFCNVRLVEPVSEPAPPRRVVYGGVRREDGRPWIDVDVWRERMGRYLD